jgi:hypothetical protein
MSQKIRTGIFVVFFRENPDKTPLARKTRMEMRETETAVGNCGLH